MDYDIVFPEDNEEEFAELAQKLDIKGICFCYSSKSDFARVKDKLSALKSPILKKVGIVIDSSNQKEMVSIKDRYGKEFALLFAASDPSVNRYVIEKIKPDIIYGFEDADNKDFMHQRGGSLNQILCGLMSANDICMGISMALLQSSNRQKKAKLLGRIAQNIRLCRKYHVNYGISSFAKAPYQMKAFHDMLALRKMLEKNQ